MDLSLSTAHLVSMMTSFVCRSAKDRPPQPQYSSSVLTICTASLCKPRGAFLQPAAAGRVLSADSSNQGMCRHFVAPQTEQTQGHHEPWQNMRLIEDYMLQSTDEEYNLVARSCRWHAARLGCVLCQQLRAEGCPPNLCHSLGRAAGVLARLYRSPRSCCGADRAACSNRSRSPAGWGRLGHDGAPSPPCKPGKAFITIHANDGHAAASTALLGTPHLKHGRLAGRGCL